MAKTYVLKDYLNEKGELYEQPPNLLQVVESADYIAEQIMKHFAYGYQMMSVTPLSAGQHAGRLLVLFTKVAGY